MNPMIIIGCGGSGGKTVLGLRRVLELRLRQAGWTKGIPEAWQLLWIDTLEEQDVDALKFGSALPAEDYISLSSKKSDYADVHKAVMRGAQGRLEKHRQMNGWVPLPTRINRDVSRGAGQMRALGRMTNIDKMAAVGERIKTALTQIRSSQAELDLLTQHLTNGEVKEANQSPYLVVVSSLAGGTGAGIFLDVCDIAKVVETSFENNVLAVLYSAEIFKGSGAPAGLEMNTIAAISELMNSYLRPKDTTALDLFKGSIDVQVGVERRHGPDYPFIIGLKDLDGTELESAEHVYRAVTETLASILLDKDVSGAFTTDLVGNWQALQMNHASKWKHHNTTGAASEIGLNGVVSSFGSARLSLGLELFGEYSAHRMAREAFDFISSDFISRGRQEMNRPEASTKEVLTHYKGRLRGEFLEKVGMSDPTKHFLDLDNLVKLLSELINEKKSDKQWSTPLPKEQLRTALDGKISSAYVNEYKEATSKYVSESRRTFTSEQPARVLGVVSSYLATYGLPVARMLVKELREQLTVTVDYLRNTVLPDPAYSAQEAASKLTNVLASIRDRDKINSGNQQFRSLFSELFRPVLNKVREQTIRTTLIEAYSAFDRQFLANLDKELERLENEFAKETGENSKNWPTGDSVPKPFKPSPLEFCLIDPVTWPDLYRKYLAATVQSEQPEYGLTPDDFVRGELGKSALLLDVSWVETAPAKFKTSLRPRDFLERARTWIHRRNYPFGDFLHQSLRSYLADTDSLQQPIPDRIERRMKFYEQLKKAIDRAKPLVHVDGRVFFDVHPGALAGATGYVDSGTVPIKLEAEKIPLDWSEDEDSPYQQARRILLSTPGVLASAVDSYFDSSRVDAEGILFVYRLSGAIHPAAISSLSAPIAAAWAAGFPDDGANDSSPGLIDRRARRLKDFVALRPSALNAMCRGWLIGRALGFIKLDESGIAVSHFGEDIVSPPGRFVWPLLGDDRINKDLSGRIHYPSDDQPGKVLWLGGILESTALAHMLFATDDTATDGHEALFTLGTQYQEVLRALKNGAIFEDSQIGQSGAEGLLELMASLRNNLADYEQIVAAFVRSRISPDKFKEFDRDRYLHPEDPYQSELAEILIEPCQELIQTCERLAKEVEVQQKKKID
jgi:hypothetical protein